MSTKIFPMRFAFAFAFAQSAEAMDYACRIEHSHVVITATGQIKEDERQRFIDFLAGLPMDVMTYVGHQPGDIILFDSSGGYVRGGWTLGDTLEKMHLNTGVAPGGKCESACVLAWAGGPHKSAPAEACIGVHQGKATGTADEASPTLSADDVTANMGRWLSLHGAPESVIEKMNATPSWGVSCLTPDDLASWGVKIIKAQAP